ncbi:MAG: hypothetical protein HY069_01450 [Chlamydiia bacterium]|nr:hypothetical protein [Chlamydiia bacterium]
MSSLRSSLLACMLLTGALIAQTAPQKPELAQSADLAKSDETNDMEALRRWLRDKRMISIKELGGDLSLSAEVRTEFQAINETSQAQGGGPTIRQRGNGAPLPNKASNPKSMYAWDVELNLMLDYRTDRSWAAARLEFDNDMGQQTGTFNKIRLEKAYLGGRLIAGDTFTMDSELGRRFLFDVYDSKIEFSSVFDGFLIRLSKAFEEIGDYYMLPGVFLINDITNHYGWAIEIGGLKVAHTGLNLKYSLIDWYRPGGVNISGNTATQTAALQLRYKYLISQLQAQYLMYPQWLGNRLIKMYAAALTNHLASGLPITRGERESWGGYAGVSIGVTKKKGDWSLDVNYQIVQAQAVPEFDANGIGRGNALGLGFYTQYNDGSGVINTSPTQPVGATNFQGFALNSLYAVTDNLTVQQSYQMSWTLNQNIGPNLNYKQYELELIYAF